MRKTRRQRAIRAAIGLGLAATAVACGTGESSIHSEHIPNVSPISDVPRTGIGVAEDNPTNTATGKMTAILLGSVPLGGQTSGGAPGDLAQQP